MIHTSIHVAVRVIAFPFKIGFSTISIPTPRRDWEVDTLFGMLGRMDADFVEFLDKKFQGVSQEIRGLRADMEHEFADVRQEIRELRESVNALANAVDKFIRMHEKLEVEQAAIIADLNRIKAVLKEKLGVEI